MATTVRGKKSDKTKVRDIVFPALYEASELIKDEYWKEFFVDLSKNKMARKIHIDDKYVSHNGKKVSFNYCYHDKKPQEIAVELRRILSDTFSMYSETDEVNEREHMLAYANEFKENKTEDDWKKVKNRKFKDHLITNYVLRLKTEHKLSNAAARYAYSVIFDSLFLYRTHKASDIAMVDGQITSIDDIIITSTNISNERLADIDESQKKPTVKKTNWSKEWTKACEGVITKSKQLLCIDQEDLLRKKRKVTLEQRQKKAAAASSKSAAALAALANAQASSVAAAAGGEDGCDVDETEVAESIMEELDDLAEMNTGYDCQDDECNMSSGDEDDVHNRSNNEEDEDVFDEDDEEDGGGADEEL